MSFTALISKILFSFILSSTVLYRYGNWFRHRIVVTVIVLITWNFSFLIIFALPLDIISTVFRQCMEENVHINVSVTANVSAEYVRCEEPWARVPDYVFPELWRTVYWSTQFLTWLVMPMMQSYTKCGDFTFKGKLKSALIDNAIYYGSYLIICGVLLIYLALKPGINLDWPKLKAIASSASNTWGLFLLVLLLGYALVEVPRNLWNNSNMGFVLTRAYFRAAKLSADRCEAEEGVDDVLDSLKAVTLSVDASHPMFPYLEIILNKIPAELIDRMHRRRLPDDTPIDPPNESRLIRLHKQTLKNLQVLQRTETQWDLLVEHIFYLEDVLRNQISRDHRFKVTHSYAKHNINSPKWLYEYIYTPKFQWYWRCVLSGYIQKSLAVVSGIFSVAVVWSELTFFNKQPVLSIFALIVNAAKYRYDYFTIEMLSTVIILYLCYCAYSTVLRIKLLNFYYLAPHHQTNEYSLIFSGMMLSRLTPPLCLNFLGLIHMDSHIIKKQIMETHYTQIMGHMDVIAIISDGFNIYFPMAIIVLCLATYFSLGSRFLSMLGFHQFMSGTASDDDNEMTTDLIEEGRELIKREKRRRQRILESTHNKQNRITDFGATRIRVDRSNELAT